MGAAAQFRPAITCIYFPPKRPLTSGRFYAPRRPCISASHSFACGFTPAHELNFPCQTVKKTVILKIGLFCPAFLFQPNGVCMKKLFLPLLVFAVALAGCHQEKQEEPPPTTAPFNADTYERNFSSNVFAACMSEGKPYATSFAGAFKPKAHGVRPALQSHFCQRPLRRKNRMDRRRY